MRQLMIMAVAAVFAGCGDGKPREKTVFDPQLDALKKARQVEQKVLDAGQKQREDVDKQQ